MNLANKIERIQKLTKLASKDLINKTPKVLIEYADDVWMVKVMYSGFDGGLHTKHSCCIKNENTQKDGALECLNNLEIKLINKIEEELKKYEEKRAKLNDIIGNEEKETISE